MLSHWVAITVFHMAAGGLLLFCVCMLADYTFHDVYLLNLNSPPAVNLPAQTQVF